MHDTAIASRIKSEAEKRAGRKRINAIVLEVGELAPVTGQMLKHSMQHVCGWKVLVREIPAVVRCSCGYKGSPKIIERMHDFVLFECPKCSNAPEVLEGGDIVIREVEAE